MKKYKKLNSCLLLLVWLANAVLIPVSASDISGVTPIQNGANSIYNIEGQQFSGSTQFRQYENFNLSQGDIANLIYKEGYQNFINLVDNQVNINGIINTMQGNNFYDGHAIFVSPNGVVIGASGLLNVGSFSALTPSGNVYNEFLNSYNTGSFADYEFGSDKYNSVINDSHGNIIVNGQILARNDVNLYGDNITVEGSGEQKANIVAGWQDDHTHFSALDAAKETFNALVSNEISDATQFALKDGKVAIISGTKSLETPTNSYNSVVSIKNSNIAAGEIDIQSNTYRDKYSTPLEEEAISSKIDIYDSYIFGNDIKMSAVSKGVINRNSNLSKPTAVLWLFGDGANIDEYFSDGIYNGFDGVRTAAEINIVKSILEANNDINLSTLSDSSTTVNTKWFTQAVPALFYGNGSKTKSIINIKNSNLNSAGNIIADAISKNVLHVSIDDSSKSPIKFTLRLTDAYNMMMLKTSSQAETKIIIDDSHINAKNLEAKALAYNYEDNTIKSIVKIGKNDMASDTEGGSGATLVGMINATDINTAIEVKNNSTIETSEDTNLNSYNINSVTNYVVAETDDGNYQKEQKPKDDSTWYKKYYNMAKDYYKQAQNATSLTVKDVATKFQKKADNINNNVQNGGKKVLDLATAQVGAGILWNNTNTTNNVVIENSTIKAQTLNAVAHTVDAIDNAVCVSSEGETIVGAGVGALVNQQNNNALVNFKNAKINVTDLNANSIVELPGHKGTFGISTSLGYTLGIEFGVNANDDWSAAFHNIKEAESSKLVPEIGLFGFFNNYVNGGAAGEKAVSASILYSQLNNNSEVKIEQNSIINAINDININAVTSTAINDAVNIFSTDGIISFLKSIKDLNKYNLDSGSGLGGSVLVQNYTNNAKATIDNSTIIAGEDLTLNSAAEQSYFSLVTPGAKANTIGVNGGVTVQNIKGSTLSEIKNSSNITAKNLNVNAGTANVSFSSDGASLNDGKENPEDKDKFELAESRDVRDHVTSILVTGSYTKQTDTSDDPSTTSSSGQAYGASVVVQDVEREIKSIVEDSILNIENDANIKAFSKTKGIVLTMAGSFAGGVSINKKKQSDANNGNAAADNNSQEMQNIGNWMDAVDNAQEDQDVLGLGSLFDENGNLKAENDPNKVANSAAQNNAGAINQANNQVNNNGQAQAGANANNSNASNLANGGGNNSLIGANNSIASVINDNMSIAAAGVVSYVTNENVVTSEIKNSTINVGENLSVTSSKDDFYINIAGGAAKSGNIGAGAAINMYTDKGISSAIIDNTKITYTSDLAKTLKVQATDNQELINVTAGVGAAKTDDQGKSVTVAAGGSFNANRFNGRTEALIKNQTTVTSEKDNNIDTTVTANASTTVHNNAGGVGFAIGKKEGSAVGAGIAGNLDIFTKNVNAQILNSNLANINNLNLEAKSVQNLHTIGIAGALVAGTKSGYTFDGASAVGLVSNSINALVQNSTISATGDIDINAILDIDAQSLAGELSFSTASSGLGAGIGVIVDMNTSIVSAVVDNAVIQQSGSIDVKANLDENKRFLAANMGVQASSPSQGTGTNSLNINGITEILKSTVNAQVINNSELNSAGDINVLSNYVNSNQGITVVGNNASGMLALGGNGIASIYQNNLNASVDKTSKLNSQANVGVKALASEYINLIPVGMTVATGKSSGVAANVAVNAIQNFVNAIVEGDIVSTEKLTVQASDDTTIYERGGTLTVSTQTAGVSGAVYFDYINKNVLAQVINNTVTAGDMTVQAIASNSFGGTKADITPDLSNTDSITSGDLEQNATFKNWNMAYSLGHGTKASVSGAIIAKVIENNVKANVEESIIEANNLKVQADDYTILNAIVGQFSSSGKASIGGNSLILVGKTNTDAIINNSTLNINNDIDVIAKSQKTTNSILVGGSGSSKVAVNGAAHVNVINDKTTAKIVDTQITNAGTIDVEAKNENHIFSADLSVSGSGTASVGGILYVNTLSDTVNAFIGNESWLDRTIATTGDIRVNADSDNGFRTYLANVAGTTGSVGVSGLGIINKIDSNINSKIDKINITSGGEVDVVATRGFNRSEKDKNNIFRNWFKDTSAYKNGNKAVGSNDLATLKPLVGGLNVAASSKIAASGSIIVNDIDGSVNAIVSDSTISTTKGLDIETRQDFVNFDAIAAVAGSQSGSLNAVGVINTLDSTLISQLIDSTISKGGVDLDSTSAIELNQLVIAGQGAGQGAAIGVVVDKNAINDNAYAYINNSNVFGNTSAKAKHSIEINNILLAGGGVGSGLSAQVVPVINKYTGKTLAKIDNKSQINNGSIDISADDYIDNFSAVAGISGTGSGASLAGFAIQNKYANEAKASIENSLINTNKGININSSSVIDSENALITAGFSGVGATLLANVILNSIESVVASHISNANIVKAGHILLQTNAGKRDNITNIAGSLNIAGEGASLSTNAIYNLYNNTASAYVDSSTIKEALSLDAHALSDRKFNNTNIGIVGTGVGAAGGATVIVNEINTATQAYINAGSTSSTILNSLSVLANDITRIDTQLGAVGVAGLGAAINANVNLNNINNVVRSEILTGDTGVVNAGSVSLSSNALFALRNKKFGISVGFGSLAADVTHVNLGKKSEITDIAEKTSGLDEAIKTTVDKYNEITPEGERKYTLTNDTQDGTISKVSGNLNSVGNVHITAKNEIKGLGNGDLFEDKLIIENTGITGGLATINVGVSKVNLVNKTSAEIAGGNVNVSDGNIIIDSIVNNNVEITNGAVNIGLGSIQGASGTYNNASITRAAISDSTVNANNITINANSNKVSKVYSDSVVSAGATLAGVSVSKSTDNSVTNAVIEGNTNIKATGNLDIIATGTTDISAYLNTYSFNIVNIATYLQNNATANAITNALIQEVNGTIDVNNLKIVSASDGVNVKASTNVTAIEGIGVSSIGKSGAYLTSQYNAGINSLSGLVVNNAGETQILSGVKNVGSNESPIYKAADLIANANINKTSISLINIYAKTEANVSNTVQSNVLLKAKEHNADNLKIDAELNAIAKAGVENGSGSLFKVNSAILFSTLNATLGIDIAGKNNIGHVGEIIANHVANNSVSADTLNVGIVISVPLLTLDTQTISNTNVNLAGDYNSRSTKIDVNTTRQSLLDLTSRSGGFLDVNKTFAKNYLTGSSNINIENLISDDTKNLNQLEINQKSHNTQDIISTHTAGGVISYLSNNLETIFDTATNLKIKDSSIKSSKDFNLTVSNENIVKDSASLKNGGVIALNRVNTLNTYTSNANLEIENSTINANNVALKTTSSIKSALNGDIKYVGTGAGFVASTRFALENRLNNNNLIKIINSDINAKRDVKINLVSDTYFKQVTDSFAKGFVAIPKNQNTLRVTNNNRLSISDNSKIVADKDVKIGLDANNTLYAGSFATAKHFGFKDPEAKSYLYYAVNNDITNAGTIKAGKSVDISFLGDSISSLVQYAYAEAVAAIPTTTEDGILSTAINNVLNIKSSGKIIAGKDVDIAFTNGNYSNLSSTIAYKSDCRVLFDIPIVKSDKKSKYSASRVAGFIVDGEIIAGEYNDKYLKINVDGSIDYSASKGFYDSDYTILNGTLLDAETKKEQALANYKALLENVEKDIAEVSIDLQNINNSQSEIQKNIELNQAILDEINHSKGFITMSEIESENLLELKELIIGNNAGQISEELFNNILEAYKAHIAYIEAENNRIYVENSADPNSLYLAEKSIEDFIQEEYVSKNKMSQEQKDLFITSFDSMENNITTKLTTGANFNKYNGKIIVEAESNKTAAQVGQEIVDKITQDINEFIVKSKYNEEILEAYSKDLTELNEQKNNLENSIATIDDEKFNDTADSYAILFNPIALESGKVSILGVDFAGNTFRGSGNITTNSSALVIDNFSNRSLLFDAIDLTCGSSGLFINNINFAKFADKPQAINNIQAYEYLSKNKGLFDNISTSGVHYLGSSEGKTGIHINNYYDVNNPFATSQNLSEILFSGKINTSDLFVRNESGSVYFFDSVDYSGDLNATAINGGVGFINENSDFNLKSGSKIFATNNLIISSKNAKIDGDIEIGYKERNLVITDDMLNNLVIDPMTGEKNLINIEGTTNNIKAIFKDGKIYVFHIADSQGDLFIEVTGNVNCSGTVVQNTGYQNIVIDNQTSNELIVNNISNINQKEILRVLPSAIVPIVNDKQKADVSIKSNGAISVNGKIYNSYIENSETADNTIFTGDNQGSLLISALNGIVVNEQNNYSINSSGTTSIINANSGKISLLGTIESEIGDILIQNSGVDGIEISNNINVQKGKIEITNESGIFNILENASITNNSQDADPNVNNDIVITHKDPNNKFTINGLLKHLGIGDVIINDASSELVIATKEALTTKTGNISIETASDDAKISSVIKTESGDVLINNLSGKLSISEKIETQKSGNIAITSKGTSLGLSSDIKANAGNISIINNSGDLLIQKAVQNTLAQAQDRISITSDSGYINVLSEGSKGVIIAGLKTNTTGLVEIINRATSFDMVGDISTNAGEIKLTNVDGTSSLDTDIKTKSGKITINNYAGNFQSSGTIISENENADLHIINTGTADIDSAILLQKGKVETENTGILKYTNLVSTGSDITVVNTDDGKLNIENSMFTDNGKIELVNKKGDFTINDDVIISNSSTEAKDIILINEMNTGKFTISGVIQRNNGDGKIQLINSGTEMHIEEANIISEIADIEITNNNGLLYMSIDSVIENEKGDITITANGDKGLNILGDIENESGAITINNTNGLLDVTSNSLVYTESGAILISSSGSGFKYEGDVESETGDITLTNTNGLLDVNSESFVYTQGGDIKVISTGNDGIAYAGDVETETGSITFTNEYGVFATEAESLIASETGAIILSSNSTSDMDLNGDIMTDSSSISISNQGDLFVEGTTYILSQGGAIGLDAGNINIVGVISNKSSDININSSDNLLVDELAIINSENGNILANSVSADIAGLIETSLGNITFNNTDKLFETKGTSSIISEKGAISITSQAGMNLAGGINNTDGSISIQNSGTTALTSAEGSLIKSQNGEIIIQSSAINGMQLAGNIENSSKNINITNTNGKLSINAHSEIKNEAGSIDIKSIADATGLDFAGKISADGDITITNEKDMLNMSESSSITGGSGNIAIISTGSEGAIISTLIKSTTGDISIDNNKGKLALLEKSKLSSDAGNISITAKGDLGANIAGEINNNSGGIQIVSEKGLLMDQLSEITTETGNIILNTKNVNTTNDNTALIAGMVKSNEGEIRILNNAKEFVITNDAIIDTYDGNISIETAGDLTNIIDGYIISENGFINILNTNAALELADNSIISSDNGSININVISDGGASLKGEIIANNGDITVTNEKGELVIDVFANIENENKDINLLSKGVAGMLLAGNVINKNGKINIANEQGNFYTSEQSSITSEQGEISVSTKGLNTELLGIISSNSGNITIENKADNFIIGIDSNIKNDSGLIEIKSLGSKGIKLSGNIENNLADIKISNSNARLLTTALSIINKYGNVEILSSGDGGAVLSALIETIEGNISIENNNEKLSLLGTSKISSETGNINLLSKGVSGTSFAGNIINKNGNINITNEQGSLLLAEASSIINEKGNVDINSKGANGISLAGSVQNNSGEIKIGNEQGTFSTFVSSIVKGVDGLISIFNKGKGGLIAKGLVENENGNIEIANQDSNFVIGEIASKNDNYFNSNKGAIIVNQTNGSIINGVNSLTKTLQSNHDLGNPDSAYKTLFASDKQFVFNVVDGDIGTTTETTPGTSLSAETRDYTSSINISGSGVVSASVKNNSKTDARLVNLRSKNSDMNLSTIDVDGNVVLTVADWKQADMRPTPNDPDYFKGYSLLNANSSSTPNIVAQNISIISSNNVGEKSNKISILQDKLTNPDSIINIEAENDIYINTNVNTDASTKLGTIFSKRGSVGFDFSTDTIIESITAAKHLDITQKSGNLTIHNIGKTEISTQGLENDMLFPHDGIDISSLKEITPETIEIKVLDAYAENGNSTLTILNAYLTGANGGAGALDAQGNRFPDVKLIADNINVVTGENATGLNVVGNGVPISIEVTGVSEELVTQIVPNAVRRNYYEQKPNSSGAFFNPNSTTNELGCVANNVNLVINSEDGNRGAIFNKLYANNANVSINTDNLQILDGYINNKAYFKTTNLTAGIDNDTVYLMPVDVQLYTAKTGSFDLKLGKTIVSETNAPVVHYNPRKLVNSYNSENSFTRLTLKNDSVSQRSIKEKLFGSKKENELSTKETVLILDVLDTSKLQSNVDIINISRKGCLIKNDGNIKIGDIRKINLKFDDVDTDLDAKVIKVDKETAMLTFINMPEEIANKLIYNTMKKACAK